MKVKKQALIRKINASLIHRLEFEDEHEISEFPFHQLVHPSRFDVLLKYLYAKAYRQGYDLNFALEVYSEHLKAWGDVVEGDLTGKDSLEKYIESFNQLLASFSNNGFKQEATYLPVGKNGIIIDGAHRSAACLAYESNPIVAHFNHVEAIYDADFFKQRGLSQVYLDTAAIEYAGICSNSHIVSLFPIAGYKKQHVEKILSAFGSIVYEKQVHLYNSGPVNALAQMYKGEHWLGDRENGWPGALEHAKNKFAEKGHYACLPVYLS